MFVIYLRILKIIVNILQSATFYICVENKHEVYKIFENNTKMIFENITKIICKYYVKFVIFLKLNTKFPK